ncbi:MAG TPA: hypothetical protein VGM98_11705 [Schlesneria sp.]
MNQAAEVTSSWRHCYDRYVVALSNERASLASLSMHEIARNDLMERLRPHPWERFEAFLAKTAATPAALDQFMTQLEVWCRKNGA